MKKSFYVLLTFILLLSFTTKTFSARLNTDKFIKDLGSDDKGKIKTAQDQLLLLGKDAVPALILALDNENTQIRGYAAVTLGMMKAKDASDRLITSLKDKSSSVRVSVIWALGQIKDEKARKPLKEIYKKSTGLEKLSSAVSLIHLGETDKITVVIEFLMDENGYVRRTAANALAEIRGEPQGNYEEVGKLIDTMINPNSSDEDIQTTGKILLGKKLHALYPLIEALSDTNEYRRSVAALYLGQLNDEIAIIPLGNVLNKDTSPEVRSNAALSLKKLKDPRGLPYLKDALKKEKDSRVRADIEDAIKNIKE